MRIAFATEGEGGLEARVSEKFGRCPTFTVIEVENGEIKATEVLKNPGSESSSGAGIKAVQTVMNAKADMVVAGSIGPNAMAALQEVGIRHLLLSGMPVREALKEVLKRI